MRLPDPFSSPPQGGRQAPHMLAWRLELGHQKLAALATDEAQQAGRVAVLGQVSGSLVKLLGSRVFLPHMQAQFSAGPGVEGHLLACARRRCGSAWFRWLGLWLVGCGFWGTASAAKTMLGSRCRLTTPSIGCAHTGHRFWCCDDSQHDKDGRADTAGISLLSGKACCQRDRPCQAGTTTADGVGRRAGWPCILSSTRTDSLRHQTDTLAEP